MTDPLNFRVELEGGTAAGELLKFRPGDELAGRVIFTADRDLTVRGLDLFIAWKTEGRGNTDEMPEPLLEDDLVLDPTNQGIGAGQSLTRAFRVTLPAEPWSYTGTVVSIIWSVTATLDVPWAKDPAVSKPFLLRP